MAQNSCLGKNADELFACKKGDVLYVQGEIENNSYTDKNGKQVNFMQINAHSLIIGAKREPKDIDDNEFIENSYETELEGGF